MGRSPWGLWNVCVKGGFSACCCGAYPQQARVKAELTILGLRLGSGPNSECATASLPAVPGLDAGRVQVMRRGPSGTAFGRKVFLGQDAVFIAVVHAPVIRDDSTAPGTNGAVGATQKMRHFHLIRIFTIYIVIR